MFLFHTLQYPEIVQEVQDRGGDGARRCNAEGDPSRDGEVAFLLRVDVYDRRDQSR